MIMGRVEHDVKFVRHYDLDVFLLALGVVAEDERVQ